MRRQQFGSPGRRPGIHRVERHDSGALGRWELVRAHSADPRLRGLVIEYTGFEERTARPLPRLEPASAVVPVLLCFEEHWVLRDPTREGAPDLRRTSFAAGLHDRPTVVVHPGRARGLQIDLTPLGARMLLGLPLAELTGRVEDLGALVPEAGALVERLAAQDGWQERFAVLDRFLGERAGRAAAPRPEIAHAWRRLAATGGRLPIAALAAEVGWSRRHLARRFEAEIGLPPKVAARLLRFDRVAEALRRDGAHADLATLAYAGGYADQSHLNRDFRAFAATTPAAFRAALLPDGGGAVPPSGKVPSVQDGAIGDGLPSAP